MKWKTLGNIYILDLFAIAPDYNRLF